MENRTTRLLLIATLVAVLLLGAGLYREVRRAARPVAELGGGLATEVAGILHPTPTLYPDPVTIIREVRSLSRLETAQYTIEKVITAEVGQGALGGLFGDKLLFVAHGVVIAGVDLSRLSPQDLQVDAAGFVTVALPAPEVFVATLDNQKSYVYDRQTGLLTKGQVDLETQARRLAESEIRKAALEDGILELAQANARSYLERLLRGLGFREVIFVDPLPARLTPTPGG